MSNFEGLEIRVPAMRGKMGSRTFYSVLMPMSGVPQFFKFTNWAGISPEDREQRVLNDKRVPDLAGYISENEEDYLFSSITASYKSEPRFEPYVQGSNIGMLILQLGDEFIINDGQHRCAGIVRALESGVPIAKDTISVLLFPWENTERVQQMFSDLNRFVQKTSKSLDILYDKRDEHAAATLGMIDRLPVFRELTDKENVSLGVKSTKLFTLAALYDANVELLKGRGKNDTDANIALLVDYWKAVAQHMPDWTKVLKGQKLALELRQEKISSHSTVLRALGGLGLDLLTGDGWQGKLAALEAIDWGKRNSEWEGVCMSANSVLSNRQSRAATKAFIKAKLGMPLSDSEARSLPQPITVAAE
ncbi:DNA sulfur modification protein DndB [Methylovirgula ligni]|uniref:DNA sulfur modification protein DndB n=1 Tax=Methylovirgula ligni TaxID=569860 RepID=A0A3D9YKU6_9HYPH|nr:DNA sulfur modification protein DndB [Methylovirgula ligni]QAY96756.1 DNA sulfur modification protein DndB [Methylovirgula ligni]REF83197.1 DNA sulfur modification protein DndB [Methylovirgula ligni]